jgi:hypothetical protein
MTIHEKLKQLFNNKSRAGKVYYTAEIINIVLSAYPGTNIGSILPNDHGEGNASACKCAGTNSRIFDRIKRGLYRARS